MKRICAVTGLELTIASHFSNYFTRDVHPLLEVKTSKLLALATSKSWLDWQDEEAKLLFLALASSLQLIEVIPPAIATPSEQAIASSIEMLVAVAGWHSGRAFHLPTMRISIESANSSMEDFPNLLNTIIATREETIAGEQQQREAVVLEEAIKILFAKCSIGANKHKMLRSRVADWALKITAEAAKKERVDAEVQKLWHTMLTTAPVDAWKFQRLDSGKANNDDLLELDEFMICNLPHGCSASYEVMKHITAMKNATINLADFLGIDNVITVISTEQVAASASIPPVESNFATKLEFLIAKAKYQVAIASASASASASAIAITSFPVLEEGEDEEGELEGEDSNGYGI